MMASSGRCVGLGITEEQISSAADVGDEAEKAPLAKLEMREYKAPEIHMKFPSPSMAFDLDSSAAIEDDLAAPAIEPVVRVRKRSRPSRRFRPSSTYSSSSPRERSGRGLPWGWTVSCADRVRGKATVQQCRSMRVLSSDTLNLMET